MKKQTTTPVSTVLVITVGFLVVYLVSGWKWAVYTALIVGIAGVLSDSLAKLIDAGWTKLSWLLGLIVPNILLSAVFYLFLTPIAWIAKAVQKTDPLHLRNKTASVFKDSNKSYRKESFEKPW